MKNLEKYKEDLKRLLETGHELQLCMNWECNREQYVAALKKENPEEWEEIKKPLEKLPPFAEGYQIWYSEAKTLIRQLLPDRLDDFIGYYEKPKGRKDITCDPTIQLDAPFSFSPLVVRMNLQRSLYQIPENTTSWIRVRPTRGEKS